MPLNPLEEARRILHEAEFRGVTLRLLGGTAVLMRCPSAGSGRLTRARAPDIDLAGFKKENSAIKAVFEAVGYEPNEHFNALHGYKQLMFYAPDGEPKVDVFLDQFEMCHRLDLRPRLGLSKETLPLADLLFTKLQIVEINEKDIKDIVALFLDHDVVQGEQAHTIDGGFLAQLSAEDWGVYTTFIDNLRKVQEGLGELGLDRGSTKAVADRIGRLRGWMDEIPKSLGWRLRAKVGRRMAWYELPDEPKAIVLGPGRRS